MELASSIIDSISAQVAAVDASGRIFYVNERWKQFAIRNGNPGLKGCDVGANYFDACRLADDSADGADAATARCALEGMLAVSSGVTGHFEIDYPCQDGGVEQWFVMRCTPLPEPVGAVVVTHTNITDQRSRSITAELNRSTEARRLETAEEFHRVEELGRPKLRTGTTARSVGSQSLREAEKSLQEDLVKRLGVILDLCVENRVFKSSSAEISRRQIEFAEELGRLRAGPKDLVELYTEMMKQMRDRVRTPKLQAYLEEGRIVLLELMGNVLAYYRLRATNSNDDAVAQPKKSPSRKLNRRDNHEA